MQKRPCDCKCKAGENQSKITEETIDSGDWTQPHPDGSGELLKLIYFHGGREMAKSYHIALYHSDFPLDDDEKSSLYDVIALSKSLKKIKER